MGTSLAVFHLFGKTPSGGSERTLYSEALANEIYTKKFKLTVKSNEHLPPDSIKDLLKTKINPTEIKVGINSFKSLKKWEGINRNEQ